MSASAHNAGSAASLKRSLASRHARERRFRRLGMLAVISAIVFVAVLFSSILIKGAPAFEQATLSLHVTFDPAVIRIKPRPQRIAGQSPADFARRKRSWQRSLALVDWNRVIETALRKTVGDADISSRDLVRLIASAERFRLRDMVAKDPAIIGATLPVNLLASADVDVWLKGNIDHSLPDNRQQLSVAQRRIVEDLSKRGILHMAFAKALFLNVDSRSSPASAGLAGAFVGSLYMMLVVIALAVPIGVASAVYLEEFAPKNRVTDFVEVNINNLAAVPSIVFGLLGAAVFIGWFHLPLSAPLVGGLILSLMTLPVVIIATRVTLRAIPASIRHAALGLGASPTQMVFHHVLPLAVPGILTATIIGVAQALGETAPLLLIGMNAFVAHIPQTPLEQSTALPVQIFLWQGNENRNFFESRTSAAIIVLIVLMIGLNGLAVFMRQKFERRW
ncbi:MAG: phosphate ABC transporter permease PstA [Hyphomicrobiales bacterium]